jgi:UDP-N-acetylglucosamine 2-epimerase (non-hydrolysing)
MTQERMKIVLVAGARPNFMKVAPIIRELRKHEDVFDWRLVHTGQHFDHGMSDVFFEELGIPQPHFHMGAGGGSHSEQTARIMVAFERYCNECRPDLVIVVGDVDSTLACAIVTKKMQILLAHVEAGLRSCDMTMPEEINRMVTDAVSDYFFVTEDSAVLNLRKEGHADKKIHFVGHVMIDNLFYQLNRLREIPETGFKTSGLKKSVERYGVVTLHRPSSVDHQATLSGIVAALNKISDKLPLFFPIHPRTAGNINKFGISLAAGVKTLGPLPYMEFLNLWKDAALVLTDSGGLQEETTALGIPCVTVRENTERPVTVTEGSNVLAGTSPEQIIRCVESALQAGDSPEHHRPLLWDGAAATRIIECLMKEWRSGNMRQ